MISIRLPDHSRHLRVFHVPELLSLICSFSRPADRARLARTCKVVFKVATAFVWNHVDGAQHLLMLLSGTRAFPNLKSPELNKIIIGMAALSDVDFSRFELYAPYVRRLTVYGTSARYFQVEGWHPLILRAQQRTLLPNLLSITMHSSCDAHGPDQLIWIKTFISPTLLNIQASPHNSERPPRISHVMASVILDTIANRCPRLLRLSLFPSQTAGRDKHDGESSLLGFMWKRPFPEYLRALPTLVELSCSTLMLEQDSLRLISALPQLRRLSVYTSGSSLALRPPTLPQRSFPALRDLHLKGLDPYEVTAILDIPSLMSLLVHIELKLDLYGLNEEEDREEWIASSLLSLLQHAPHLSLLDLDLDPNKTNDEPYDIGNQDLMDIFSKLPLVNVTLFGVHLGDWAYTGSLKSVWPVVTHLHMRDQFASPLILSCFSQLPKIQHLTLNIYLEDFVPYPKVTSLCPLHTLQSSPGGSTVYEIEHMEYTGGFLLALFPNLCKISWPEEKANDTPELLAQQRFIGFLNIYVRLKKENELLKTRTVTRAE